MLLVDARKTHDGKPLRRSWHLPFLSGSKNVLQVAAREQCLYEAQVSATIIGIDHRVWTAYGAVDAYYGSNETADFYYNERLRANLIADPLTAGQLFWNGLPSTPREYFFNVLQIRINQVRREWLAIVEKVDEDVKQYVLSLELFLQKVRGSSESLTKKSQIIFEIMLVGYNNYLSLHSWLSHTEIRI